jgi:hypothetical protein
MTHFTRNVVERTLQETLNEMLSDAQIRDMCKKATLKKLKHRLDFKQVAAEVRQAEAFAERKSRR